MDRPDDPYTGPKLRLVQHLGRRTAPLGGDIIHMCDQPDETWDHDWWTMKCGLTVRVLEDLTLDPDTDFVGPTGWHRVTCPECRHQKWLDDEAEAAAKQGKVSTKVLVAAGHTWLCAARMVGRSRTDLDYRSRVRSPFSDEWWAAVLVTVQQGDLPVVVLLPLPEGDGDG